MWLVISHIRIVSNEPMLNSLKKVEVSYKDNNNITFAFTWSIWFLFVLTESISRLNFSLFSSIFTTRDFRFSVVSSSLLNLTESSFIITLFIIASYRQISPNFEMKNYKIKINFVSPEMPKARANKTGFNFIIWILIFV